MEMVQILARKTYAILHNPPKGDRREDAWAKFGFVRGRWGLAAHLDFTFNFKFPH